ncbi:Predicted membrane protein [Mucilaginibacter lappiensis]|uniref:Membrane protein n=1 Tax=Mucilaginibacter lappiensis TaxID=354630 RepID=A0ABR6PMU4_9SPHI|nr:DUF2306 domain-containing protein [Mucilaginibacter lappiensis]MBB6111087.1 putative membrane protein [Mucilaginibacter lappiensis]SIR68988.1 Predicted membrane protein [Mucilaginibacter lappiensis]
MKLKKISWVSIVIFAIIIGLYPLAYYFADMKTNGLLSTKPREVLSNSVWHAAFYTHITFGGIALLTGWPQFSQKLREKYLSTHRLVGKIYVIAVALSSISGLFIAFFATGGIGNVLGFGILAMLWFISVFNAYRSILKMDIYQHENWMIRNYALTLAAVTLRIWLPLLSSFVFHDFIPAYRIVSWLCWVPNLIIAEVVISKRSTKTEQIPQAI